jgi:glycosyltransferase involved in cell wall biosynthesis
MVEERKTAPISVIIPAYNAENFLRRALESIFQQTLAPQEIIVVDDGSTDNTGMIAKEYADRVRYIRQANAGVAAARNTGIRHARSEWIAFLDADDEWLADKLQLQHDALAHHADVIWSATAFFNIRGKKITSPSPKFSPKWFRKNQIIQDALVPLASGKPIWTGTVMIKRSALLEVNAFDSSFLVGEDLYLWTKLAVKYPRMIYLTQSLAKYHHDNTESLTTLNITKNLSRCHELSQQIIAFGESLDGSRKILLQRYAKRIIINRVEILLFSGNRPMARQTLKKSARINLNWQGTYLNLFTHLPLFCFNVLVRYPRAIWRRIQRLGN